MSTSPSWFDQEKFSRLVKKVGPKPAPEQAASGQAGAEPPHRHTIVLQKSGTATPAPPEGAGLAFRDSAPLPQVEPPQEPAPSPPPTPDVTPSDVPASPPPSSIHIKLPRRTSSLPALKALFQYAIPSSLRSTSPQDPSAEASAGEPAGATAPPELPLSPGRRDSATSPLSLQRTDDLADAWQKIAQLNEELAHLVEDRDQAVKVGLLLREQLRQADEALGNHHGEGAGNSNEDLTRLTKERDDALAEVTKLREQPPVAPEPGQEPAAADLGEELALITAERDDARRQYASLREEYENLKQEHDSPKEEPVREDSELEKQIADLRRQLEERNVELKAVKSTSLGLDGVVEKNKQELTFLREQLTKAREEASIAQRGLALSQKALHETRDTLRDATEGTSLSRTNFENLKTECASLLQQNQLLKAQNEQFMREVGAIKSKITTRL